MRVGTTVLRVAIGVTRDVRWGSVVGVVVVVVGVVVALVVVVVVVVVGVDVVVVVVLRVGAGTRVWRFVRNRFDVGTAARVTLVRVVSTIGSLVGIGRFVCTAVLMLLVARVTRAAVARVAAVLV